MTIRGRLWLLWLTTVIEIPIFGIVIAKRVCPARVALEELPGVLTGSVLPALRGEARCWALFLLMTVVSVALAVWVSVTISRRARMAS